MPDFIKQSNLKQYITKTEKTRITKSALDNLTKQISSTIVAIIKKSKDLSQKDKRTTIMPKDISTAIENIIGRKHLTWEEVTEQLIRLGPIELGEISKAIDQWIEKQKK